jgi:Mrp family chromosome partitioning ATPase
MPSSCPSLVDGAIVVAGSGLVERDELARTLESLESVNGRVLGIVLNRVPVQAQPAVRRIRLRHARGGSSTRRERKRVEQT